MTQNMLVSVIVSTYNNPSFLSLVLSALAKQTDRNFEVVVADDGSSRETAELVNQFTKTYPIHLIHAWQEDKGYRLAASRNNGVKKSSGKYLIFLDGDCVPLKDFVEQHRRLAEKGFFVTGNRVLLSKKYTEEIIATGGINLTDGSLFSLVKKWRNHSLNRILPLLHISSPLFNRKSKPLNWQSLRGCNFAVWRDDYISVNGSNEDFVGWGFEDSELAVRLINSGKKRKSGNFATGVLHLYHLELKVPQKGPNWERLQEALREKKIRCSRGIC